MKRTMVLVAMVLVMLGAFSFNAHAGIRDEAIRAKFEKEILDDWNDSYEMFKEEKADGEIHLVKDVKMTYNEVGINVYDMCIHVVLEDGKEFEFHTFYDAVEDEELSEGYFQFGEERMSYDEFEELYSDIFEEIQ